MRQRGNVRDTVTLRGASLLLALSLQACSSSSGQQLPPNLLPGSEECPLQQPACVPSKEDVIEAMKKITPPMKACLEHWRIFQACIHFGSDGSVTFAGWVEQGRCHPFSSAFLSDPKSGCADEILRSARVPPFQKETFRVSYPFVGGLYD